MSRARELGKGAGGCDSKTARQLAAARARALVQLGCWRGPLRDGGRNLVHKLQIIVTDGPRGPRSNHNLAEERMALGPSQQGTQAQEHARLGLANPGSQ